ncbi:MAG: hypothetical protein JXA25_20620 [Anaerolineales bacterium]|nr:hypothetical protein [Anaerolineales bacterium]
MKRKGYTYLIVLVLLVLSLACSSLGSLFQGDEGTAPGALPSDTPEPVEPEEIEEEEQASEDASDSDDDVQRRPIMPTPTPFHVLDEDDIRATLDLTAPDFVDYFVEEFHWFTWDDQEKATYNYIDGMLEGTDHEPEEFYNWWSYNDRFAGNVYAEISATNGDCIDKDAVGFVIRVDQGKAAGGYALEVSCDGNWRVVRHRIGKTREVMLDWQPSDLIETGEGATNRLGIWGYQPDFQFFINGVKVGEAHDPNYSYTKGIFAVYVHALYTYDLTATFDDFAYWNIELVR